MIIQFFDLKGYQFAQVLDAVTCPLNRSATMIEHGIDEWELYRRGPAPLITHYIENGGAVAFARRRAEFVRIKEIPDEVELEFYI